MEDYFDAMMESQLMGESFYANPLDEVQELECEEDDGEEDGDSCPECGSTAYWQEVGEERECKECGCFYGEVKPEPLTEGELHEQRMETDR